MGKLSVLSPLAQALGGLVTVLLALQTLFPQYEIIPLNRTQYTILLVCSLVAWAIWVIWLFDQHHRKKKPSEPDRQPEITLHLQPTLRNKLETLHAKLTDTTIDIPTLAISWFESDIERMGYLKALQDLSPELVASFNEMRKLVMDLMPSENNPITHKEAREQLGDKEYERQASSPSRTVNVRWINVWWDRERNSPELQAIINKVKMQIQDLMAKSN